MSKKTIRFVGLLGVCAFSLTACMSQVPYPTTYTISTQQKMQAAYHWQVLSNDLAEVIKLKIDKKQPLFVERKSKEPFAIFLSDFLEQSLINEGYKLTSSHSPGALPITLQAKVIEHSDRYLRTPPGMLTALASGVWVAREMIIAAPVAGTAGATVGVAAALDALDGMDAGPLSRMEVVVSMKILKGDQILMSENNIYYINEEESWQYDARPYTQDNFSGAEPTVLQTKKMSIAR